MPRLTDNYNRGIDYLRISITDRCNLRCRYCMPPDGIDLMRSGDILRYEELLRIARIAASNGISKMRITGGEPLVRKGLVDFIASLASIKGVKDISMTTNGILLGRYAADLKKAGLKRVNISLDSLKEERFFRITRGNNLKNVLDGIEKARQAELAPIKINMVVIKGFNDDEILDFARITSENSYHVRYIEYMPFETDAGWKRDKCISSKEIIKIINSYRQIVPTETAKQRTGPAKTYKFNEGGVGILGFISPVSDHFCGSCNRLRLTADGKLRVCLFSDNEINLKTAIRSGCSDKTIENLLLKAAISKPEGHHINDELFKKSNRTMSLIGG